MLLSIILLLSACDNSNEMINTEIPVCIQEIIDEPELSSELKTVRIQEANNELHYWLNTDFRHADGIEYIVNSSCDTICSFCGECLPPGCSREYDENWITIWEK